MNDELLSVESAVDIPAAHCPNCTALLEDRMGLLTCGECGSKSNVNQPSLRNAWAEEKLACPGCSRVLIAGVNKRPAKLQCSSCEAKFVIEPKQMKVDIGCPGCERTLRIRRAPGERMLKCPSCEREIKVKS